MLIGGILRIGLDIGGVADVVKVVGRNGYVMRGVLKLSKGYFGERYLIVEYIILENSTTYLEKSSYFVVCKVVILEKLNLFSGICRCLSSV